MNKIFAKQLFKKQIKNNQLQSKLRRNKVFIESELKKTLNNIAAPKVLKQVMKYAVFNGGKRIRPFILSEVCTLFNVRASIYKFRSMAVEMAHCFSLIYDDLPCMDDDELRRGKPTVHLKFNEANALLGGASLLTFAYEILASKKFNIEDKKKILLLENFSHALGYKGMLAGQLLDLEAENPKLKLTIKKLDQIQERKTGLLIAFCSYAGGLLGDASKKELSILFEFGLMLGRIFQITDDILDMEGNAKTLGKKVNKDASLNKATIIRLKGVEFAKKELSKKSFEAKSKLNKLNKNTLVLSELIDYICQRTS